MIRVLNVQGNVLIDDKKRGYQQMAHEGMLLDDSGEYLLATNASSSVSIQLGNGEVVRLGPLSYLANRPGRSWWGRHGLAPGGDARRWVGLIWMKCGGESGYDSGSNAASGIRG